MPLIDNGVIQILFQGEWRTSDLSRRRAPHLTCETRDSGMTREATTTTLSTICATTVCFSLSRSTGKERDTESGNDYFGSRYYGSSMGRFMSPDSGVDQHPADPQSWNLYSYVRNNPLTSIDPSGDYMCGASMTAAQCDSFQGSLNHAQTAADQIKATYGADSTQYKDAERAINSYGAENVANGVTVNIGNTAYPGQTTATDGAAKTDLNPTGQNIQVTINSGLFGSGDANGISATVAHEGSHVGDAEDWAKAGFTDAANPTSYNTEYRAYGVTTSIMEAFGAQQLSGSHDGVTFHKFWMKGATDVYNNQIGRPAMIKTFYPNWALKAFQKNVEGGGQ
jgi:RHS repeat-associated protein